MVEVDFERRLERLFAEGPDLPDADAFAEATGRRLNRGWTARRWLIGAAGVAGGAIGASQLLMSDFLHRLATVEESARLVRSGFARVAPRAEWLSTLSTGGSTVWIAAAIAVLLLGFALSRVIEEI
jgi:hypothetical protein